MVRLYYCRTYFNGYTSIRDPFSTREVKNSLSYLYVRFIVGAELSRELMRTRYIMRWHYLDAECYCAMQRVKLLNKCLRSPLFAYSTKPFSHSQQQRDGIAYRATNNEQQGETATCANICMRSYVASDNYVCICCINLFKLRYNRKVIICCE